MENSGTRGQRVNPGKSGVKQLGGGLGLRVESRKIARRGFDPKLKLLMLAISLPCYLRDPRINRIDRVFPELKKEGEEKYRLEK